MTAAACPFCDRIKAGEWESFTRDNPAVVWFEPLNPVTPGHLLFIPARHVSAVDDPARSPYEAAITVEVAIRWAQRHSVGSYNLIVSAGAEATQTVPHLHVHLIPRREGDGLTLPWTGQAERAQRQQIRDMLLAAYNEYRRLAYGDEMPAATARSPGVLRADAIPLWQQMEAEERGREQWIADVKRRLGRVCIGDPPRQPEAWPAVAAGAAYEVISDHTLEVPRGWPPECRCVLLDGEQVSLGGPCPVRHA